MGLTCVTRGESGGCDVMPPPWHQQQITKTTSIQPSMKIWETGLWTTAQQKRKEVVYWKHKPQAAARDKSPSFSHHQIRLLGIYTTCWAWVLFVSVKATSQTQKSENDISSTLTSRDDSDGTIPDRNSIWVVTRRATCLLLWLAHDTKVESLIVGFCAKIDSKSWKFMLKRVSGFKHGGQLMTNNEVFFGLTS